MKQQILALTASTLTLSVLAGTGKEKPNIIIILADDLGYGDVSANGSTSIKTPNIDRIADEGIRFTNGYATSATSTPSRYSLLTGMYPWKNKDARILPGDAPLLINESQYTLPEMMQNAGYQTAAIGKWHLGMGRGNIDWNKKIKPGANEIGFDYSCLIAATNDRVPTVYVENGNVLGLEANDPIQVSYKKNFEGEPTALNNPELLKMQWSYGHNNSIVNGIPRIGYMKGGTKARWVDEDMADFFVDKVKDFVNKNKNNSFFLYYGLHEPHVPRAPHARFAGMTSMGPRGDAIMEADWCVGQLLEHLEKLGIAENTLIIFSSDNGPVLDDGYKDQAREKSGDHQPAGPFRGGKYSLFDGGTHVPFFVCWKRTIKPQVSDALICQMDLFCSLSTLLNQKPQEKTDGQDVLPALLGKTERGRKNLIIEAQGRLAFRSGDWVYIPSYKGPQVSLTTGNELGNLDHDELFNLRWNIGQTEDFSGRYKRKTEKMKQKMHAITEKTD